MYIITLIEILSNGSSLLYTDECVQEASLTVQLVTYVWMLRRWRVCVGVTEWLTGCMGGVKGRPTVCSYTSLELRSVLAILTTPMLFMVFDLTARATTFHLSLGTLTKGISIVLQKTIFMYLWLVPDYCNSDKRNLSYCKNYILFSLTSALLS